jgi:hypothetical protein
VPIIFGWMPYNKSMTEMLETPDQPITLHRAAQLAGLSPKTLGEQVRRNKLGIVRFGHERLTTRRLLHEYLAGREEGRGHRKPLPSNYVAPEERDSD